MPTVFRTMKAATDGLPVVGDQSKELGVRVPPNPHADVDVDGDTGLVMMDGRGMSVAADWRDLPFHLIPKRLNGIIPRATAPNVVRCYRLGTGPFSPGDVSADLMMTLKHGQSRLGNVHPSRPMTVADFQAVLAGTRTEWLEDES